MPDVVAAVAAGVDLLLTTPDAAARDRIETALLAATFDAGGAGGHGPATRRAPVVARRRRARPAPGRRRRERPHAALAMDLAARAVTVVRDPGGLIGSGLRGRVLAIMPAPQDLTPADTSSTVAPALGDALRRYHHDVDELVIDQRPDAAAIAAIRDRAAAADTVVIGTIDAHRQREQLAVVEAVAGTGRADDRGRHARPVGRGRLPGRRHGPRHVLDPVGPRSRRWPTVLAGRADAPGRLPVRLPA